MCFPFYGLENKIILNFDSKFHDSYLMKCLHNNIIVREPAVLFIKWLRPKGLKVCSKIGKYGEFKNQILKNIGWYTKLLCAAEYPGGRQFLKLALKWGNLYHRI